MRIASFFGTACSFGVATVLVFCFAGASPACAQESLDSWRLSGVVERGREIVPMNLNLEGKNPQLVYLGSYIVNAQGGCNSCHTCPSFRAGDPFKAGTAGVAAGKPLQVNTQNYLAGGVPFGAIKSPNLTPDNAGLPGGMTYEQFLSSMQNGQHHLDAQHVLQSMPWPNFRNMFEGDLAAVYEYLRALPTQTAGTCSRANDATN